MKNTPPIRSIDEPPWKDNTPHPDDREGEETPENHCAVCGDPIPVRDEFCSDDCRDTHDRGRSRPEPPRRYRGGTPD